MTAPVVLARADWGADPVVRSSNGQPRARLVNPSTWLTVHYTGNASPLYTPTRDAVIAAQQALERFAVSQSKPNEYNWCLYDAGGVGFVVEYAGGYVAAHSAGENDRAIGVLFYVGVGQGATDAMVDAYRYLRDVMLTTSLWTYGPNTAQTPHKAMPGAATPCPGPVLERWDELLAPYAPPSPAPNGEPAMTELWMTADSTKFLVVIDGEGYNFADNAALDRFRQASPRFPERIVSPGLIDAVGYIGTIF